MEDALGTDEVGGYAFGDPVPDIDVKLGKNPGGSMAATVGTIGFGVAGFSSRVPIKMQGRGF